MVSVFTWRRVGPTCAAALTVWPRRSRRCCARIPSAAICLFSGPVGADDAVLMYDTSGFLLMQKRLTEGKFIWPSPEDGIVTISRAQMSLLIDGLDWRAAKSKPVVKPMFIV